MKVTLGGTWELTTERAESSYNVPVLVNRASGEAFGPGDIITPYPSWGMMPAIAAVERMAKIATLTDADLAAVQRFGAAIPSRQ